MIRTFTSPPFLLFSFFTRRGSLWFSLSITSMFLADWESLRARAPPWRGSVGHSKADSVLAGWLCILVSVFKQMARALVGGGRFFFGASFLLAPSPILRIWWPDDAASGPIALGLARGLGARDAVLGLGILAAVLRRGSPLEAGCWLRLAPTPPTWF